MQLVQLYIPRDAAHTTIDELGELGLMHFRDLNPHVNMFQRAFINEVKQCDEMERRLRYIREQIAKEKRLLKRGETLVGAAGLDEATIARESGVGQKTDEHGRPIFNMVELDAALDTAEHELRETREMHDGIKGNFNELLETMHVLHMDNDFYAAEGGAEAQPATTSLVGSGGERQKYTSLTVDGEEETAGADESTPMLSKAQSVKHIDLDAAEDYEMGYGGAGRSVLSMGFVTGVVLASKVSLFERVLWRALHGNLFFRSSPIEDDEIVDQDTDEPVDKCVFIVFFHGQQGEMRIRKLCDAFNARVVAVPQNQKERTKLNVDVETRIKDMRSVLEKSAHQRRQLLAKLSLHMDDWTAYVRREKGIAHTMNLCNFDAGRKSLIAEGWIPEAETDAVLEAINTASRRCGSQASIMSVVQTSATPPTFFRTTDFTSCFNSLIQTYGVSTYGEINPATFSIITFPFLFAIMFGDFGHAFMLLLCSIVLCIMAPKLMQKPMNDIMDMMVSARYLLVLMALFSLYTGLLYNDCFSIPIPLFKTAYYAEDNHGKCRPGVECMKDSNYTYPFGLDPIWRQSQDELYVSNSFKMKMSIIFGVVQMLLGVFISFGNHLHFKKPLNVFFDFIPQVLFMLSTFGYLVLLIFLKWLLRKVNSDYGFLINVLINMFLSPGKIEKARIGDQLKDVSYYKGQGPVQVVLVLIALVSMIMMFIPKPLIQYLRYKKEKENSRVVGAPSSSSVLSVEDSDDEAGSTSSSSSAAAQQGSLVPQSESEEPEQEVTFGGLFINQCIHSIEYVLGCVSNTASYLRLWALSLAHSELSIVFYQQLMLRGLASGNFIMVFVFFGAWGGVTVAILLGMEALSAFLHCLRLHWVEFMNKFYMGEGYEFTPFSFKQILAAPVEGESPQ